MIGDIITIKDEYFSTAETILSLLDKNNFPKVFAIGGESGSGKSVTSICLQKKLKENGVAAFILHIDDYFIYPPITNHDRRVENIERVGEFEVNLTLLQKNVNSFLDGEEFLEKPIVNYRLNQILSEQINLSAYKCLIIEGTYSFSLKNIDCYIFMDRTYKETYLQRKERGREKESSFIEEVLAIEHKIIRPNREKANFIVLADYSVIQVTD